jgi:hypothetical protein
LSWGEVGAHRRSLSLAWGKVTIADVTFWHPAQGVILCPSGAVQLGPLTGKTPVVDDRSNNKINFAVV